MHKNMQLTWVTRMSYRTTMKKPISIRIEETDIERLKSLKIHLPELVRKLIAQILEKNSCPVCNGQVSKTLKGG